jgi:hypothetical protein
MSVTGSVHGVGAAASLFFDALHQPAYSLSWPKHFTKLGHIKLIVGVMDNEASADAELGEGCESAVSVFLAVSHSIADGNLVASEAAPWFRACDNEIISFRVVVAKWRVN